MYIEPLLSDPEERPFRPFTHSDLADGELYLFRRSADPCDGGATMWGVYCRRHDEGVFLESSSIDLRSFATWHPLPEDFRYCRMATRDELRDYTAAITFYDCTRGVL